eukprot:3421951-Rhodomonas_salina.1
MRFLVFDFAVYVRVTRHARPLIMPRSQGQGDGPAGAEVGGAGARGWSRGGGGDGGVAGARAASLYGRRRGGRQGSRRPGGFLYLISRCSAHTHTHHTVEHHAVEQHTVAARTPHTGSVPLPVPHPHPPRASEPQPRDGRLEAEWRCVC